jgi:hypothetical protein
LLDILVNIGVTLDQVQEVEVNWSEVEMAAQIVFIIHPQISGYSHQSGDRARLWHYASWAYDLLDRASHRLAGSELKVRRNNTDH